MIYWSRVTIILIVRLSKSQYLKTSKGDTKEQYSFKASLLYISTLFLSSFATLLLSKDHFYMGWDGQSELRIVRMETQTILVKVIQDADGPMLTGYEWREYDCPHRSSAFYLGLMLVFLFQVVQGADWICVTRVVDCFKTPFLYISCKWSSGICNIIQHNLTRTR